MFQLNALRNLAIFLLQMFLLDVFFQECFKTAEVILTYKNDKPAENTNYRPISILTNISKIYERLMHDSMSDYFNDVLSKFVKSYVKT